MASFFCIQPLQVLESLPEYGDGWEEERFILELLVTNLAEQPPAGYIFTSVSKPHCRAARSRRWHLWPHVRLTWGALKSPCALALPKTSEIRRAGSGTQAAALIKGSSGDYNEQLGLRATVEAVSTFYGARRGSLLNIPDIDKAGSPTFLTAANCLLMGTFEIYQLQGPRRNIRFKLSPG